MGLPEAMDASGGAAERRASHVLTSTVGPGRPEAAQGFLN